MVRMIRAADNNGNNYRFMNTSDFVIRPLAPAAHEDHTARFIVLTKLDIERLMVDSVFRRALNRDIVSMLRRPIQKVKQAAWLSLEITDDPDALTCVPGDPQGSYTDVDVGRALACLAAFIAP